LYFPCVKRYVLDRLLVLLLVACVCSTKQVGAESPKPVKLPDTPASKQFADWLEAYNTGQRETIRQFVQDHFEKPPKGPLPIDTITDRHYGRYRNAQGYELKKIAASKEDSITAIVQEKRNGFWTEIRTIVTPKPPHHILGFGIRSIEVPEDLLPAQKLTEEEIRTKVEALIKKMAEADTFSGTILIAKDGKPIYEHASGLASRVWNIPNRIDTKLNIASLGKMFTAVAVAQLVEKGNLSYEDTLEKVLLDYPNKEIAQKITVHHLLTHTSGLGNRKAPANHLEFRSLKEHLPSFATATLKFEPGAKFDYSNDGYMLLGLIIEKASNKDYYEYMRENIYKPAGMIHSDSYDLDTEPANLATGYMDMPNGSRRSNIFKLPVRGWPSGLGYSTVKDLLKFDIALRNHTLLSETALDLVWTGRANRPEPGSQYGYGFHVKRYNGTRIVGHGGGWVGINSHLDIYPDLGYTFAVLTNYDAQTLEIAFKLREWLTQGYK
jgi:CubicO group peptidase (beta-lactamase class C family)